MKSDLIKDLMPWSKTTDLGLARRYHLSVSEVKLLRDFMRRQIKWQTSQGPPPNPAPIRSILAKLPSR